MLNYFVNFREEMVCVGYNPRLLEAETHITDTQICNMCYS